MKFFETPRIKAKTKLHSGVATSALVIPKPVESRTFVGPVSREFILETVRYLSRVKLDSHLVDFKTVGAKRIPTTESTSNHATGTSAHYFICDEHYHIPESNSLVRSAEKILLESREKQRAAHRGIIIQTGIE